MAITSHIKFFLADEVSLATYLQPSFADFKSVERQLLIKAREQDRNIPDHYYRHEQKRSFESITSLAGILTTGISRLANECLQLEGSKITVKQPKQLDWQELITHIPPLILQCSLLSANIAEDPRTLGIQRYFNEYILLNARYTALPSPTITQLDDLLTQQSGLHDLHMHLNGATETDMVWQDYLRNPIELYNEFTKAYDNPKVKEQLLQESPLLTPKKYYDLLRTAQKLRHFFYGYFFPSSSQPQGKIGRQQLQHFVDELDDSRRSNIHDFTSLISIQGTNQPLLAVEGLMYILILTELQKERNETLANFFHFYLLILGLTNRLLVQQVHQKGFEQFQKHTFNKMREYSERKYKNRFLQMQGNSLVYLRFLEGRFAPKDKPPEMVAFIGEIYEGWGKMEQQKKDSAGDGPLPPKNPELKLIAHFIKERDNDPDSHIRHRKLRSKIWRKAKAIRTLINQQPHYKEKIAGIDAAASEFDAPPEVFAPAFRLLRRAGIKHFTYHAGEDFFHILCGLRAIYEAITFCDLNAGDRIGHATASGISVETWHRETGSQILIRQGEYLDDLVFTHHLIENLEIGELESLKGALSSKAESLSKDVYGFSHPISILQRAWLMRQLCPVNTIFTNREDIKSIDVYCPEEWDLVTSSRLISDRVGMEYDPAWQLYQLYHDKKNREIYEAIISIAPFEICIQKDIETLQLSLLAWMHSKGIIIETLPTSNVRIGFHRNFSSYHLLNWLGWQDKNKIPPIVVGTDDTGIFATNIYNEYSNIYCCLENLGKSPAEITQILTQLDQDSQTYRFD